jgi:integrase
MAARKPRVPGYRPHASGQARVTLDGKDFLLGPYGSAESREAYRRLVAEYMERKGRFAPPPPEPDKPPLSVNELLLAYYKFAVGYYGFDKDDRRGDGYCLRDALRVVKELYGSTSAKDFGPLALKACRGQMVKLGWSRTYVNAQTDRVRRAFRWAVEEEMVPGAVYEALRAVRGIRRGKGDVRETEKVRPVEQRHVEAALPFMPPVVAAMVRLQLLTGCRPAEVCLIRPCDLERANPLCWVYRPGSDQGDHGTHKTAHHGHDRLILLGPRAQAVLRPFLDRAAGAYCFVPVESERRRNALRRLARRSPLTPSQRARKPKVRRRRAPGDRYDTHGYRRAIKRACLKATVARLNMGPCHPCDLVPEWSPNQLRHSRATELRAVAGLDVTKTVLGHSKVETTLLYAEKDLASAMELVARIG